MKDKTSKTAAMAEISDFFFALLAVFIQFELVEPQIKINDVIAFAFRSVRFLLEMAKPLLEILFRKKKKSSAKKKRRSMTRRLTLWCSSYNGIHTIFV